MGAVNAVWAAGQGSFRIPRLLKDVCDLPRGRGQRAPGWRNDWVSM